VIAELCHFKTVICLFTDVLQHRYYASIYRYKHPVYNPTVEIASTQYTDSSRLSFINRRPRSLSSRSHPSSPTYPLHSQPNRRAMSVHPCRSCPCVAHCWTTCYPVPNSGSTRVGNKHLLLSSFWRSLPYN
jgi:hypothetical protein